MCSWFPVFLFFTKYQYVCIAYAHESFFLFVVAETEIQTMRTSKIIPAFFHFSFSIYTLRIQCSLSSLMADALALDPFIVSINLHWWVICLLHQVSSLFYLIKNASTINSFYTLNCTESTINWWIYIYCNVSRWILWLYTKFNNFDLVNFVANNNVWQNLSIKKLLNGRSGSDGPRILDGKISKGGFGVKAWALAHFPK